MEIMPSVRGLKLKGDLGCRVRVQRLGNCCFKPVFCPPSRNGSIDLPVKPSAHRYLSPPSVPESDAALLMFRDGK
jgi:hypothetical protein